MADGPFTSVGRIVKTHGLKGEVSVISFSDASLSVLEGLDVWIVPPLPAVPATRIVAVRQGPKGDLLTLAGVDSIDAARDLPGRELLVKTEELPHEWDLTDDLEELLGTRVVDVERGDLGEIEEVLLTGANDVWVVRGPLGEVLIPVIDDVVLEFDAAERVATVRLLEGLLPDESGTP